MRAAIFALAGFALLVVGMFDFVYGGGVAALFVWPLAIVLEIVTAFLAVRILARGESGAVGVRRSARSSSRSRAEGSPSSGSSPCSLPSASDRFGQA